MLTQKELQKTELEILKVTLETLRKHDIRPFLVGGSCLGAVRHKGFIPWDDDIDIGLFRNDYEKAREILLKELPEGYYYCDRFTEAEYPYGFGKVKKKGTAFVHGGDAHLNTRHGIYIDIFPMDVAPSDDKLFAKQDKKVFRQKRLIDLKFMDYRKYGKLRPLWQRGLIFIAHTFVNGKKAQDKLDKMVTQYNETEGVNSEYVCSYFGIYRKRERVKREWIGEGKECPFEDITVAIPKDAHSYLTHVYGDYMQLPPEEKRVSHHDAVFISLTEEYKAE